MIPKCEYLLVYIKGLFLNGLFCTVRWLIVLLISHACIDAHVVHKVNVSILHSREFKLKRNFSVNFSFANVQITFSQKVTFQLNLTRKIWIV